MKAALSFLTVAGRAEPPGPRTADWFPVVGAIVGLGLGGVWWLAGRAWPPGVAAGLVVAADLAVTGMLHLDGLADSADGLLAPMDRATRLRVMAAPDTGAFGTGAVAAVLLLRWTSLSGIRPAIFLVGGLWCLSRTLMAIVIRVGRYARPEGGLAAQFAGPLHWPALAGGLVLGVVLCAAWRLGPGLVAAATALGAGLGVVGLARRRIGGYTGDVLGASAMVAETAGLLVSAARW